MNVEYENLSLRNSSQNFLNGYVFVEDALPLFVIAIIKVHILKHFFLASQFERNITGSPVQKLQLQNGLSYSNVSLMKNEPSQILLKKQKVAKMNRVKRKSKLYFYQVILFDIFTNFQLMF